MTSSSSSSTLADLQIGDIVRVSQVVKVTEISSVNLSFVGRDEKRGADRYFFAPRDNNTVKVELLHRPKQKPQAGDRLTGPQVYDTQFKRGTILEGWYGRLMLMDSGLWKRDDGRVFSFDDFRRSPHGYDVVSVVK